MIKTGRFRLLDEAKEIVRRQDEKPGEFKSASIRILEGSHESSSYFLKSERYQ